MKTEALLKLADWLEAGDLGGDWKFGSWATIGPCGTSGCAIGLGAIAGLVPGVTVKVLSSCSVFEYDDADLYRSKLDGAAAAAKAFDIPYSLSYDLFVRVPDEAYAIANGDSSDNNTTPQMIANRIREAVETARSEKN